MNIYV
jgi:serine/threonine protein kinase